MSYKDSSHMFYIIPEWRAPESVYALMTTRLGGVSLGPYASLNLGSSTNDDPLHVQANQKRLCHWLSEESHETVLPVFLQQVHGTDVINLDTPGLAERSAGGVQLTGDASFCTKPGIACVVRVADCMPVLLAVPGGVAAVHAGWRGLAGGIIENALRHLLQATRRQPEEVSAWLGPCIGPDAFEVGDDVRTAFVGKHSDNNVAFCTGRTLGKWWANLPMLGKLDLERCCVQNIWIDGQCTVTREKMFYSYRRDQKKLGDTGRMAACIWLSGSYLP